MKMENLETERLIICPIALDDVQEIFKYRSDSVTNKYQGFVPKNLKDVYEFIGKTSTEIDIPDTWFQFVIIQKESDKIIGDIGIHFLGDDNQQVEIGCTLSKHFHKQGYASEALNSIITYLFNVLNKHRIIASIDPRNIESSNLMNRLGFRQEAHFKESILINGMWVDDIIFAVLKSEW